MDADSKEKLIEIVRKYECLYNASHKEYKNNTYKCLLWEKIGATLKIEAEKAKETWRTLRDGYVRYKKQAAGKSSYGRKYSNYTWSSQMTFLDPTIRFKSVSNNKTEPNQDGFESPQQSSHVMPLEFRSLTPQPGTSNADTELTHWTQDSASSTQSPKSSSSLERAYAKKKIRFNSFSQERTNKVLEYLQNKNWREEEYDDVDYLFKSYAKTFKKLSLSIQAELKYKLAKLFAEAELRSLDGDF